MNKSARFFMGLLVPAFMLAGVTAHSAMAQDKAKAEKGKATLTVLAENEKVRVYQVQLKPGDVSPSIARPFRVVRALKGGTLSRTYADGKTEKREYKAGQVSLQGPDAPFSGKNIGKTEVVLYVVQLK